MAGVKWIGSFPENLRNGQNRASAVIILNCVQSGRPKAILEGSSISAKRTAASAMLAVESLQPGKTDGILGLIGCGRINFEILNFFLVSRRLTRLIIYDVDPGRAQHFKQKAARIQPHFEIEVAPSCAEVKEQASLISIATTASTPHIFSTSGFLEGALLLHISLRDLSPEFILACNNFVDDLDHVFQGNTSLELAWRSVGHRNFVQGTLPDLLRNNRVDASDPRRITVFSPFGLGILDLALSNVVCLRAAQRRLGTYIPWFKDANQSAMK
jgi:ornithine cyclodeaminase